MPEDPQQSKLKSKITFLSGGTSVKIPEDPQQSKYGLPPSRDPLQGFVFSRQRRTEALERFRNKRRLRAIAESSERIQKSPRNSSDSDDDDVPPPPGSTPGTGASKAADKTAVTPPPADKLIVDELDVEEDDDDDMGYTCPYCYVEYDFIPLCHHLGLEHYNETAETICTICADKISGDMLRHFTTEHEALVKIAIEESRLRNIPNPRSQELSLSGRNLREAHLKTNLAGEGQQQSSSGVSDPLLSSLVLNYPAPGAEEISKLVNSCAEDSSKAVEPAPPMWQSSSDPSLSSEERERRARQAAGKAAFVQDLVFSTMFKD